MQRPDGLDKQSDRLQIVIWTFGLLTILVSTGAGFVWGYERHVRSYTQYMRDRLVRLTFAGAVCLSLYAGPLYWLYTRYFRASDGEFQQLPAWIWPCLIVSVMLPWTAGEIIGRLKNKRSESAYPTVPTGFDYAMRLQTETSAITLVIHLKNNNVVIGCPEHAAVTPHVLDIYLNPTFFQGTEDEYHNWMKSKRSGSAPSQLDFELGYLFEADQPLTPQKTGILVRYEDVTYISVIISAKSTRK